MSLGTGAATAHPKKYRPEIDGLRALAFAKSLDFHGSLKLFVFFVTVADSFEWVSFRCFSVRHGIQEAAQHPVQRRHAVPQPDGHRFRPGAQCRFGFQRGAAQREALASPRNGVANRRVQQAEVNRQTLRRRSAVNVARPRQATVVVPVLNQQRSWLRQCIVSACTQTAPVEAIVVTSPRTRASTIRELRELRGKYGSVRVLPEEGEGFAAALNTGIRAATAARVGFLLSDDWLDPDAVEQCLGHDADIVSTGLRGRAADGVRILEEVSRTTSLEQFRRLPSLERKASYLQHFFLFRKRALREVGG